MLTVCSKCCCFEYTLISVSCAVCVSAVIVGGIDMMSQALVLAKKPHVVIGKRMLDVSCRVCGVITECGLI